MSVKNFSRDAGGHPIPALAPITATTVSLAVAGASANVGLPTNCREGDILRVASDVNVHIVFSDTAAPTATTSDMLFPSGSEVFQVPAGAAYFAAITGGPAGTVTLTELT